MAMLNAAQQISTRAATWPLRPPSGFIFGQILSGLKKH